MNSTATVVSAGSTGGPMFARAGYRAAARLAYRERLVHRAVVAVAEHEDLLPPGELAGDAQCRPVGVGCAEREQPAGQREPAAQFLSHPDGVLGRQHRGDAPPALLGYGLQHGGRPVAGHRPGGPPRQRSTYSRPSRSVMDAPEACAANGGNPRAQCHHPGHRHPAEQRVPRPGEEVRRHGMLGREPAQLPLGQAGQPGPVDHWAQPIVSQGSSACPRTTLSVAGNTTANDFRVIRNVDGSFPYKLALVNGSGGPPRATG